MNEAKTIKQIPESILNRANVQTKMREIERLRTTHARKRKEIGNNQKAQDALRSENNRVYTKRMRELKKEIAKATKEHEKEEKEREKMEEEEEEEEDEDEEAPTLTPVTTPTKKSPSKQPTRRSVRKKKSTPK
jgi:chromosome segregation ATPase